MTGTVSVPWLVPGGGVAPPQMPHLRSGVMGSLSQSHSGSPGAAKTAAGVPRNGTRRGRSRGRWVFVGATLGAAGAAGVAYIRRGGDRSVDGVRLALGWGEGVERPDHTVVRTLDGAQLAVWDLEGGAADAPVVVLPHCWGCSHEVWLPVTRRLREEGYRVVLYDQRGHGASTRGTAPLTIETLAHDLTAVLDGTDVRDVVLAGHSMGGMTIMSLATHRPAVLKERGEGDGAGGDCGNKPGRQLGARGAGRQRTGGVGARHVGDAVQEWSRFRPRCLRSEPGPLAHGSDQRSLRWLSRGRAG